MKRTQLKQLLYFVLTFIMLVSVEGQAIEKIDSISPDLINGGEFKVVGFTNLVTGDMLKISVNNLKQSDRGEVVYFVETGDSLYRIARRFNSTVDRIKEYNNLQSEMLLVGQRLVIPGNSPGKEERTDSVKEYVVEPGDSLFLIGRRFNVSVDDLRQVNDLETDMLLVGQELIIPLTPVERPEPGLIVEYIVEERDSLIKIARKFDVEIDDLLQFNDFNIYNLQTGQRLQIPIFVEENQLKETISVNENDLKLLARAIYSESRGEPFSGQVAVAAVVLNRLRSPLFPNSIRGILFQPWQFSAVHDGQFWLEPSQEAFVAARAALEGWDPTGGAYYYYNPHTATSDWVFYRNVVLKIGNHYFAV